MPDAGPRPVDLARLARLVENQWADGVMLEAEELATLVAVARAARADHDDDGHGCPRRPDRCAVCIALRNVTDTAAPGAGGSG